LLDLENQEHHRIAALSKQVGIALSSDHAALAAALTEHVYWASRYPTPRCEAEFHKARRIIDAGWPINLARYESLWTVYRSAYWPKRLSPNHRSFRIRTAGGLERAFQAMIAT
jgi:hypothetical protein